MIKDIMFFQYTLNINSHGYLASPDGGEFDDGFRPHSGKFDKTFFEKSNSRGFAWGGDDRRYQRKDSLHEIYCFAISAHLA
jgi:hypothetical protein